MSEPAAQAPWDRQPDEPPQWFARFDAFRLLGPSRTLEAVWASEADRSRSKRPSSQWYAISGQWRWKERAEAWDASERPTVQQQRLAELANQRRANLELGELLIRKSREALEGVNPADMTPADIVKMMESGIATKLRALEEPILEEQDKRLDALGESEPEA